MNNEWSVDQLNRIPKECTYDEIIRLGGNKDTVSLLDVGVEYSVSVINYTDETIVVKDRFGKHEILEPKKRGHASRPRCVKIVERTKLEPSGTVRVTGVEYINDSQQTEYTKAYQDVLRQLDDYTQRNDHFRYGIVATIQADRVREGCYIPSIDKVIYLESSFITYEHPESKEGRLLRKSKTTGLTYGLDYRIEIFDRAYEVSSRWININGTVMEIPINRTISSGVEDGVELTMLVRGKHVKTLYSIDEADDKLRLYRSKEEATIYGDLKAELEATHKELLSEQQKVVELTKAETTRMQVDLKHTELQHETQLVPHRQQLDGYKRDMEILKTVVTMVAAILSVITLIKKS